MDIKKRMAQAFGIIAIVSGSAFGLLMIGALAVLAYRVVEDLLGVSDIDSFSGVGCCLSDFHWNSSHALVQGTGTAERRQNKMGKNGCRDLGAFLRGHWLFSTFNVSTADSQSG